MVIALFNLKEPERQSDPFLAHGSIRFTVLLPHGFMYLCIQFIYFWWERR